MVQAQDGVEPLLSGLELCALAVLLFLYDSTVFLYADEVILSCDGQRVWHLYKGWRGVVVAGRTMCLLNPLAMAQPCVRLRWNLAAPEPAAEDEFWSQEVPALRSAGPWTSSAAVALWVLLPLGLFTALGAYGILAMLPLLYGSILCALLLIRRRCALPTLRGRRFAGLLFECLACPPFGVNLIRRVALATVVREPLLHVASRLLPPLECDALRSYCVATLDRELQHLDETSALRKPLELQRAQVDEWMRFR